MWQQENLLKLCVASFISPAEVPGIITSKAPNPYLNLNVPSLPLYCLTFSWWQPSEQGRASHETSVSTYSGKSLPPLASCADAQGCLSPLQQPFQPDKPAKICLNKPQPPVALGCLPDSEAVFQVKLPASLLSGGHNFTTDLKHGGCLRFLFNWFEWSWQSSIFTCPPIFTL